MEIIVLSLLYRRRNTSEVSGGTDLFAKDHSCISVSMRAAIATSALVAGLVLGFGASNASAETAAAFDMPLDTGRWQMDVLGQNGMYRFRQTDGDCQISFAQNLGANAARSANRSPQNTLDNYIRSIAARVGDVSRSQAPAIEVPLLPDEKVTFISEEIAYTGVDKVAYHNRISTQWVGDVEMLIIAACPSKDWSQNQGLISAFLGGVSIRKYEVQ